jgi:hypothetical protein
LTAADITAGSEADIARKLVGQPLLRISKVGGGRNSRISRVETTDGVFALKQYPSLEDDPRNRLGVETNALKWMALHGLDMIPHLVAVDTINNCVLLSWVEGSHVSNVGPADIDQAIEFLGALERLRRTVEFPTAQLASEACLSGAQIEHQIRMRFSKLLAAEGEPGLRAFLSGEFLNVFESQLLVSRKTLSSAGLSFEVELGQEKRSLIPADFGFHNALRDERGRLIFLDFEYFGWDDPAKLTSDVLLHPGTRVVDELRSHFRIAAETLYGNDPDFGTRLGAFHPLFGLRWVLILLNEFHPERWRRRVLAGATDGWAEAKERQLRAARAMLTSWKV